MYENSRNFAEYFVVGKIQRIPVGNSVPGRFVLMHFRSRERNDHIVDVTFPGTKLPIVTFVLINCRLLQLSLC